MRSEEKAWGRETIRDLYDAALERRSSAVFLRHFDGSGWSMFTYGASRDRVLKTLAVLLDQGLTAASDGGFRQRVAIMRENGPEWIFAYLALAGCGFVVVPVDPHLRSSEASHILLDSGAAVLLADDRLKEVVEATGVRMACLYAGELAERTEAVSAEALRRAESFWAAHRPQADDVASVVYTSGTTGRPKGAMLTHGNFSANVEQTLARVKFVAEDHHLIVLPLFHVFAFTLSFMIPLKTGAQISFARTMRAVPVDMAELKPSVFMAVPLLAELLYDRAPQIVSTLRVLGVGGAPISRGTLDCLRAAGVFVLEGYGITECAPGVSYPDEHRYVPGTVGCPLDGMEWRITESDETGAGELRVKGPNVMKGYWNNPSETAKAFDADGFYRTGDIVRPVLNGNFTICGRTKALIVNREGKNIYPEEIERTIRRCPFVADVVVVGYRVGGETGEHVGAIVVPNQEAVAEALGSLTNEAKAGEIRRAVQAICHEELAEYKLPRKIDVRFAALERTSSMKVRRFIYARALDE